MNKARTYSLISFVPGGVIPDAAAIHAARKQRQAARDVGNATSSNSYIPLRKKSSAHNSGNDDSDDDEDNVRIKFAGIQSGKRPADVDGNSQIVIGEDEDEEHGWEQQQIRKAILPSSNFGSENLFPPPAQPPFVSGQQASGDGFPTYDVERVAPTSAAVSYNLEGIKGRIQLR